MNDITNPALIRKPETADFGSLAGLSLVSRIYCGRGIPAARRVDLGSCTGRYIEVTDRGVDHFIRHTVAQHFPDGWTILETRGGWRDTDTGETITERGFVVEVAHGPGDHERVEAVAREWKRLAQQQAVMVTTTPAPARFV